MKRFQKFGKNVMSADNQMIVTQLDNEWCTYMQLGEHVYSEEEIRKSLYFKKFGNNKLKAIMYANKVM